MFVSRETTKCIRFITSMFNIKVNKLFYIGPFLSYTFIKLIIYFEFRTNLESTYVFNFPPKSLIETEKYIITFHNIFTNRFTQYFLSK